MKAFEKLKVLVFLLYKIHAMLTMTQVSKLDSGLFRLTHVPPKLKSLATKEEFKL